MNSFEELAEAVSRLKKTMDNGGDNRTKSISKEEQVRNQYISKSLRFSIEDQQQDSRMKNFFQQKSMSDQIAEAQDFNDEILLTSQLLGVNPLRTKTYHRLAPRVKAAMSTQGAGTGAEWVPVGYSSRLFEKVNLEMVVGNLFEEIPMPAPIYTPPSISSDSVGYLVAENSGADDDLDTNKRMPSTNPGTTNFTLTAKKLGARIVVSDELSEDSIGPLFPMLQRNLILALANAEETALINGDDSENHMDIDVISSLDARKAWAGLRKLSPSGTLTDLSSFTGDTLSAHRAKLGKYGIKPNDLALICSINTYLKHLMNLKDSDGNRLVTTVDKYGKYATILTGELGKIFGIPIVISENVREDLNASGVYDASTTTKTSIMLVNRRGYIRGDRRILKVKSQAVVESDQTIIIASMRKAFSNTFGDDETVSAVGYNIAT